MPGLDSWIALSLVPEIGNITFRRLLAAYEDPGAVFDASIKELTHIAGMTEKKAANIKNFSDWKGVKKQLEHLRETGVKVLTCKSREYPDMLKQIDNAPNLLYVKGGLGNGDKFTIAIVGPRKPTYYGRGVAEKLSGELASSGFTVVSGMARGIDTVAHSSALKAGGRTIAVLGSGMDVPYPPENMGLMQKISESGCVITEFPLGTKPLKENFPARNRLISGLSLGVLVVEANRKSGSLITADCALEQNREVFAVPGNINSPNSSGSNDLIKKGAKLVQGIDDIIEELAPALKGFVNNRERLNADLTGEEKQVCDILTGEAMHIDTISRGLSMPSSKALALLLGLELKGVARQTDGKRFYLVQG